MNHSVDADEKVKATIAELAGLQRSHPVGQVKVQKHSAAVGVHERLLTCINHHTQLLCSFSS